MTWNLLIDSDCIPVALRAGARLACQAGSLWVTVEHAQARRSEDIVLLPGQSHCVTETATYFLSALRGAGAVQCRITAPQDARLALRLA
ncbi:MULTISPECIES: DUF2917 domain-containing protein [unclassified Cupriavidus]|uniref:DUF2917 domain-containing protein n=1 Tax=unclassified Cupriavidus TaxID=2640874 RepID=UPI0010F5A8E3|nr:MULTISPECIES: DUF2917 domain-containing protein [unclassified Cupriavidus]MWL90991.1 DUF2917 domain-containing protein [Cupriavidus sp. SW-Y-13]